MEPPPNYHENLKFLECENAKIDKKRTEKEKGHSIRLPYAIRV